MKGVYWRRRGRKHGFFNERAMSPWSDAVLYQTDLFLSSLGYLKGKPALQRPDDVLTQESPR